MLQKRDSCKPNKILIVEHREIFESRISAGATEKPLGSVKSAANIIVWSNDMEGHLKKFDERCCELANMNSKQL